MAITHIKRVSDYLAVCACPAICCWGNDKKKHINTLRAARSWKILSAITLPKVGLESLIINAWWRHQMETFSALLAICAGNSPVPGEFPAQRPVTRSFDVFFDLRLNKRLNKQSSGWWFETICRPLWRHCNGNINIKFVIYWNWYFRGYRFS